METQTLKDLLSQGQTSKNKSDLISFIKGIHEGIGSEEYAGVTGIQPAELEGLTKADLIAIIEQFKDAYKSEWEDSVKGSMATIFKKMEDDEQLFSKSNASNADFAAELGSIDFKNIISGPLDACVQAQANASISTVDFIKQVAFDDDGKLRTVDFSYDKTVDDGSGGTTTETVALEVPFISTLTVPSIRIESCEIDFNVKLNSVYTKDVSTDFELDAGLEVKYGPVKFDVEVSYQRSMSTGVKVEKEYSLGVKVQATNDQLPGGLEKVLGILAG